jgi:hypothetical protein
MPEFCVNKSGAAPDVMGALTSKMQPIELTSVPWQALLKLIEQQGTKNLRPRPAPFGQYQVRLFPSGGIRYLSPAAMRQLAFALTRVNGLSSAQSDMLQRLKLRLG